MMRVWPVLLACAIIACWDPLHAQPNSARPAKLPAYGSNADAGGFAAVNDIKLYYESYGTGQPMLLIHGNDGRIADLTHQITHFAKSNRVIVADSRGHGKSDFGSVPLRYTLMADDLNALLEHLSLKTVHVVGFSDGGILGLLLAIHHPDKVAKLIATGANLEPKGAYDWALRWAERQVAGVDRQIASGNKSAELPKARQKLNLLLKEPNIPINDLKKISAPTLIVAGDKDVIRAEHTLKIFQALPSAHLAVLPGTTHFAPEERSDLFFEIAARFLTEPFSRPQSSDIFR